LLSWVQQGRGRWREEVEEGRGGGGRRGFGISGGRWGGGILSLIHFRISEPSLST